MEPAGIQRFEEDEELAISVSPQEGLAYPIVANYASPALPGLASERLSALRRLSRAAS